MKKVSLIRLTIVIIVVGISIIGSLVVYLSFSQSKKHALLQSYEHMETIIDLISQGIENTLDEKLKLLAILKEELLQKGVHTALINSLLEDFDAILYADKEGNIIKYWSKSEKIKQTNISYREYFIRTKETLRPYISDSFKNIVGNYGVALTVPIVKNNSFNGLVLGGILIGEKRVNYLLSSIRFHRSGVIKILDGKGIILFSEDPTEIGKIWNKFPIDYSYRSIRIEKINGKDYVVGTSIIPGTNWRILATVEKEDILYHSYRSLRNITILSAILLLTLFLVIIIPLRRLTTSINLLRKTAMEYVLGDPPKNLSISNYKEIGDILNAFQEMRNTIKEREKRLKEEQTYLETLLLEMGEGVIVLDNSKRVKFANKRFLEMTGYSEKEIRGIELLEIFDPNERESIKNKLEECIKNEECKGRISIIAKDKRLIPTLSSIKVLRVNEEALEYLIVFSDLTEIEKKEKELEDALEEIKTLNEELNRRSQQLEIALASLDMKLFETERAKEEAEKLAITDSLTGLFNRRFLEEKLANELIRVKAFKNYLSIVMADIDHFKRINDTYGHKVGDEVLKMLGIILKANVREEDVVARYGGEEFVILLHNVSKYDAYKIAERIRIEVEETSFKEIGVLERITISFGISCFPTDGEEAIDLLRKADQALYQAKSSGRNRVVIFTEPSESIHF